MTRVPRESLDYDTWLQQRAALTDEDTVCKCGHHLEDHSTEVEYSDGVERECDVRVCPCGAFRRGDDDNVPDEADTDPDYD